MLQSRIALITGSTSGIGLAVAEAMAEQGCHIVLNGFGDSDDIANIKKRLSGSYHVKVYHHPADVSKPEDVLAMVLYAQEVFGRIDILVNNAGVQHVSPIEDFSQAQWDRIIAINLSSVFHSVRAALPGMKERGFGRIINIASIHALVASPYKSAYVASKHGVAGLTKTIALESAQSGVTCNAICPGYVLTPLVKNQIADTAKARGLTEQQVMEDVLLGSQPTKQFTDVKDIAAMAVFLAGENASNVTGSLQVMDGGYIAV
ncbi:3-hydroxybutyrate dehydrogenase [Dasania marina]|uniref:3-hydroxybutyrate dehydrogenase n=1 Tax=Dasania marina TaxID=471499 RepID=UPI00037D5CF8|nr:3-hydroxybutyrate dehydrogenase [Dasania marina]